MERFEQNLLRKWLDRWQQSAGEIEIDVMMGLRSGMLPQELKAVQEAVT
ncbi:MAG: hypothetical protein MOB07_28930 [Acidobacteria bacterium]|nr:hypothetical protein [Acidobacteriota bacterium]